MLSIIMIMNKNTRCMYPPRVLYLYSYNTSILTFDMIYNMLNYKKNLGTFIGSGTWMNFI